MRTCNMQRRHFEMIARVIREMPRDYPIDDMVARIHVAAAFADALNQTNCNFNRSRFLEACQPKAPIIIDN